MPPRSLNDLLADSPVEEIGVKLGGVDVTVDVIAVAWPIPGGDRRFLLPLPIAHQTRAALWHQRTRAAFTGDMEAIRGVSARAWLETHRTAAMRRLGFARTYGKKHLRPNTSTPNQVSNLGILSATQLERVGRDVLMQGLPTLQNELVRVHFPETTHSQADQALAAAFLNREQEAITKVVQQLESDQELMRRCDAAKDRDAQVNHYLRSRLQQVGRRASGQHISPEALVREALLRVIETDVADALIVREQVAPKLDALGLRLYDLVHVGEPRGTDPRVLAPPLASSPGFRTMVELFGGFANVPDDMLILPDLIDVLAGANPRQPPYAGSIRKAVGYTRMVPIWLDQKRTVDRVNAARTRAGPMPADPPPEVVPEPGSEQVEE